MKSIHKETGSGAVYDVLCRDTSLEDKCVVMVSPYKFEAWVLTHMFLACADMSIRSAYLSYDEFMRVTKQFHFLVALGTPVFSESIQFSEYIQFQCNCGLFWKCVPACPAFLERIKRRMLEGFYLSRLSAKRRFQAGWVWV
jgi:hypothetical protein